MNRKLLITLLHKNIEELNVITEGFMEMEEYPAAIIYLAKRKTEDIQTIIDQLTVVASEQPIIDMPYINVSQEKISVEVELLKPANADIIDLPAEIFPDDTTEVEVETLNVSDVIEIPESEIIIPAFENLEEQLNPELIIEDSEIVEMESFIEPVLEEQLNPELIIEDSEIVEMESVLKPVLKEFEFEDSSEILVGNEVKTEVNSEVKAEVKAEVKPEIEPEIVIEPVLERSPAVIDQNAEEIFTNREVIDIVSPLTTSTEEVERKSTAEEHKRVIIGEKFIQPTFSRNEVLAKEDNSLSASIANKKITDIKQAISIGDRFRFQRELFKGNGEEMNRTLNYINQLATYNEAASFLMSKYGWDADNESVHDFLQLVRRRF